MYVFLGCTRACMCGCDGGVVCVGHWNASFKLTLSGMCGFYMLCRLRFLISVCIAQGEPFG